MMTMYAIRGTDYTVDQMFELLKMLPELEVCAIDNRLDYAYDMLIDVTEVRDLLIPRLTEKQLDTYYYHIDCGKTFDEVGEVLGLTGKQRRTTIHKQVDYIKKKLVKVLEELSDDVE